MNLKVWTWWKEKPFESRLRVVESRLQSGTPLYHLAVAGKEGALCKQQGCAECNIPLTQWEVFRTDGLRCCGYCEAVRFMEKHREQFKL